MTKLKSISGNELPASKSSPAPKTDTSIDIISQNGKNTTKIQNSISEQSTTDSNTIAPEPTGTWNVKGKDISLEGVPIREDIAPVGADENSEVAPVQQEEDLNDGPFSMDEDDLNNGPFKMDKDYEELPFPVQRKNVKQLLMDDEFKNNTVADSEKLKLANFQKELKDIRKRAHDSYVAYNEDIVKKRKEYDEKKNKNTREAQRILATIERLKTQRDNVQVDFGRRENRLQEKINEIKFKKTKEEVCCLRFGIVHQMHILQHYLLFSLQRLHFSKHIPILQDRFHLSLIDHVLLNDTPFLVLHSRKAVPRCNCSISSRSRLFVSSLHFNCSSNVRMRFFASSYIPS